MIRILAACIVGLGLTACGPVTSERISHGYHDEDARNLRFNDNQCSKIIDSRSVTIRSTSGSVLRTGDGFCEPDPEPIAQPTDTVALATISGDVAFSVNSASIKESFYSVLNGLAAEMIVREQSSFTIVGHTDSTGPEDYNQKLSERRARAVADFLVKQGVKKDSLAILGVGESRPIQDNGTPEGRRANRRVEVFEITSNANHSPSSHSVADEPNSNNLLSTALGILAGE